MVVPTINLSNGIQFEASSNSSILDSASKSNVLLPYSCKVGRCSVCKCKVVKGETLALSPETGLSEQDKVEGWILSCVRAAETDLVLEVEDLGGVTLPAVKTLPCRISQLLPLASDVVQVKLRLAPTAEFCFIPGQYISVIGPNGIRRSYSLANANHADNVLELHIRAVDGGAMSDYWFKQAKVNDLLRLNVANLDLFFLSTGTGIAPVKAMLESLAGAPVYRHPRSITVLWGGRFSQDLYFELGNIPVVYAYIPVLSRAEPDWKGARGYVQQVLLEAHPDLSNAAVYACGSDAMIHSARDMLVKNGLSINRFYSDAFVCSSS
jgi:CDP-4-dehydro-6-deoxyglucose reductase